MTVLRSLAVVLAISLTSIAPRAQDAGSPDPGSVMGLASGALAVRSDPPGAVVSARGPITLAGRTPWTLARGIRGLYEIQADLEGYETWRRSIYLDGVSSDTLTFRLTPKTRFRAGVRSLIVPGWGQWYAERRTKGSLFLLGTAIAGVALYLTDATYENRLDDLSDAVRDYEEAEQVDEMESRWREVEHERRRAANAYDDRQVALYALAGVYAANLLDAVLLFPHFTPGFLSARGGGFGAFSDGRGAGVGMTLRY